MATPSFRLQKAKPCAGVSSKIKREERFFCSFNILLQRVSSSAPVSFLLLFLTLKAVSVTEGSWTAASPSESLLEFGGVPT